MVGNLDPLAFILHPYPVSAHLRHFPLAYDVSASVPFIIQNFYHGGCRPYSIAPRDIVIGGALRRFILAGSADAPLKQHLTDFTRAITFPRQFKDQPDIWGSFLIWLHAAICALPVAVGTGLALVLASAELHILGTLVLDGQIPAVKLADQILERRVDAAGVPMELVTVKIIGDGNEAHTVQRENHFTDMDKTTKNLYGVADNPGTYDGAGIFLFKLAYNFTL